MLCPGLVFIPGKVETFRDNSGNVVSGVLRYNMGGGGSMARRILVVDDEESVAFFLGETLDQLGPEYQVRTACSAEEALRRIADEPFDLIVTDLRMPGTDGLDLSRQVREISPCTRTILITAYGDDVVEDEARRLGVYRYITKPFTTDEFLQVVEGALLRDMLLAQVFHELRMPLTYIMSYADMLAEESEGAHREWAQTIQRHTQRMREALDDFTLLTEWNASQMPGYLQPVNLDQMLEMSAGLLNSLVMRRGQNLQILPMPEPVTINTDGWLLGALLIALISATIKRTPEKGQICVRAKRNGSGEVTVTVKGDANGAPAEQPASGEHSAGTAVAQRLVEALRGELQVDSDEIGGAVSRVILPTGFGSWVGHARTSAGDVEEPT
jgi:CheY-like chemotaxis protein